MADTHAINVSPEVLEWARQSIGWNRKDAASRLGMAADRLRDLESGATRPSWREIKGLAKAYRRPPAALMLPAPPEEPPLPQYFRTLKNGPMSSASLSTETRLAIRRARHIRDLVLELEREHLQELNPLPKAALSTEAGAAARRMVEFLGASAFGVESGFKDSREAFRKWRSALYRHGLLVLLLPMPVEEARGFSLPGDKFPVIVASQSDSPNARLFTLFHELAHLVLRDAGICDIAFRSSKDSSNPVERFCNAFAGRFLVPDSKLEAVLTRLQQSNLLDTQLVSKLSSHFCVSQEVILRRLLDTGKLSVEDYQEQSDAIQSSYSGSEQSSAGGADYVRVQYSQYGPEFARLVLHSADEGKLTLRDAVDYLGLKIDHFVRIREFIDKDSSRV